MQITDQAHTPIVQVPSTIRVEGYSQGSPHPVEKDLLTYEYTIDQSNVNQVIGELKKKKNLYYLVSSASFSLLLFTNLIFNPTSTNFIGRSFNAVLSIGCLTTSIGTLYKHIQERSTLEKVQLLFGTLEQQNEELLSLAKGLPDSVVSFTPKEKESL